MTTKLLEHSAVISGIGESEVGRNLGRGFDLTIDACLAAIADAGLTTADIDGLCTFPGALEFPGLGPVGVSDVNEALRLNLQWYNGAFETPGQLGAVVAGAAAVASGLARHVLCFHTTTEGSAQNDAGRANVTRGWTTHDDGRAARFGTVDLSWWIPFGAPAAANWFAMYAQRHFHEYGTTREQLAQIALTCRANAAANPKALYHTPLTMDDYLSSRMISSPFCLYDCDLPCDGASAVVVSAVETTPDLGHPPIRIEAVGTALHGRHTMDQWEDLTTMGLRDAAAMLWSRTDLRPTDVDVAELYDGFSFVALAWMEALGFCPKGEGGAFIDGGSRIARDGDLPFNTHGGQLSAGRMHGFGLLHEACLQLRGEAGSHQLQRRPEVAMVAAGAGTVCGCMLLTGG